MEFYINHAKIFAEDRIFPQAVLHIRHGKIAEICEGKEAVRGVPVDTSVLDARGYNIIPGFIDTHMHGANGADVMDATPEALHQIAAALPGEGVTAFLATTITERSENVDNALRNVRDFKLEVGEAEIIGIHLEGPFLHASKAGAQPVEFIRKPDKVLFDRWQGLSGNRIKIVTLAPEVDPDGIFIQHLREAPVTVSAGHTDANFMDIKRAVQQGVKQLTHLGNAMNGIHHRDIGAVGAAFLLEELKAEVIADGVHVSEEMLQLIYRNMGSERLILISDAMRAKGLAPGSYELGGQPVTVKGTRAELKDGTLAGSVLTMDEAVKRMLRLEGAEIRDIIRMASENPAKQAGVYDRKGSIKEGKDADLLIVDDELNIKQTICRGMVAD